MISVKFKRLKTDAIVPKKATSGSAAFDCYLPETYTPITQGQTAIVPLGFSLQPPKGYCVRLIPRSGLASRGLHIANSPALVDEDYTGEIGVILYSINGIFPLNKGDRICQLMIEKVIESEFEVVDELDLTERGEGGFGSTGSK